MIPNDVHAFVPGPPLTAEPEGEGVLSGLTFAIKDIFDVAGQVTGNGNPDWARTHGPATQTAPAVRALLRAGARLSGKTIMDELAYSLSGQNHHYGAPRNPAAPGRITGGSSCGSAAAVAAGLCDFALGTDTGGSIRIPASYCGLFGLRPTHGRVPLAGVMPLAPSFDTVGWFARDAATLRRVGTVLVGGNDQPIGFSRVLVALDAFALVDAAVRDALEPAALRVAARLGRAEPGRLFGADRPADGMDGFRTIQANEIWHAHGDWITRTRPSFGPEIGPRFAWAATITDTQAAAASEVRRRITRHLADLLAGDTIVVMPTAPGIAPSLDADADSLAHHRSRALTLTAPAGLAGLPQVTVPAGTVGGCPVGLSLLGPRGSDARLLKAIEGL
jgi:amidase